MNTLCTQIQGLAAILSSAEDVVKKFQVLRDACSDEEFETLCEDSRLGDLLSSLSDLEYDVDGRRRQVRRSAVWKQPW